MTIHPNAKLTLQQRAEVQRLYQQGWSLRDLAARFHTTTNTIGTWVHRTDLADRSSAPRHRRSKRPPGYKAAVLHLKRAHPDWGTRTLAMYLQRHGYPGARRGTVRHILRTAQLLHPPPRKPRIRRHLPVGRHRVQVDVQTLPAVQGGHKREYKITVIHLRTRWKYSEIHPNHQSATVGAVVQHAQDRLPPFFLVWTDNALEFSRRGRGHTDRPTAFQAQLAAQQLRHATIDLHAPWQNGFVERSHRTDNAELFHVRQFTDPEERRYQLCLYNMYYNHDRPHQGLQGRTPSEVFCADYPLETTIRYLRPPGPAPPPRGRT